MRQSSPTARGNPRFHDSYACDCTCLTEAVATKLDEEHAIISEMQNVQFHVENRGCCAAIVRSDEKKLPPPPLVQSRLYLLDSSTSPIAGQASFGVTQVVECPIPCRNSRPLCHNRSRRWAAVQPPAGFEGRDCTSMIEMLDMTLRRRLHILLKMSQVQIPAENQIRCATIATGAEQKSSLFRTCNDRLYF